ncbi:MAG: diguanylate cyclase [Gammaproteobacteria bacterium]|nr:diguanylate cyclase [Gammaproteobacteria bacterium]
MNTNSSQNLAFDCKALDKLLRLLEPLNQSTAGKVLYRQAHQILLESQLTQDKVLRGYAAIVQLLLQSFKHMLPKNSEQQLELNLIQQRLQPPVSMADLGTLQQFVKKAMPLVKQINEEEQRNLRTALGPMFGEQEQTFSEQDNPDLSQTSANSISLDTIRMENKRRIEMSDLQKRLSNKLDDAVEQHEAFGVLLENVASELQYAADIRDIEEFRKRVIGQVEYLLNNQNEFSRMLSDTRALLNVMGNSSQQLSDELDHVRVLSLTDELTQLPNRRAFLSRLEDEIGRSQRNKSTLALAIIDLDGFKGINDRYGHNVGDEILQTYANNVLSIFRHYDMVSRYGGEEFAVILPNTDKAGALRALYKVQKKASETYLANSSHNLKVPTFSAGLAIYSPGESIRSLIERSDKAMYHAKQMGRNRIELDTTYLGLPAKDDDSQADRGQSGHVG